MRFPDLVHSAALARPAHIALRTSEATLSWAALDEEVGQLAAHLHALGIRAGDRVGLQGPLGVPWVRGLHAIARCGAIAALLPDGPDARLELERSILRPRWLVAAEPCGVLVVEGCGRSTPAPCPVERPAHVWEGDAPRVLVLTSGTSARPRAVPLTTSQIVLSAFASAIRLGHDPRDRWLACLPPSHVGGLQILHRCTIYGTTVHLSHPFRASEVAAALDQGRVSLVSLVPAMLRAVLDARAEEPFPATLRAILVGGDPMPDALLARCRALRAPVATSWGMTETASQVATRWPGDLEPRADVGPPLAFSRVRSDPNDQTLVVSGPLTGPPGVLRTADVGTLDHHGRVIVQRRRDAVIRSGGELIDPRTIEAALREHPAVSEAAVVSVPHPRWGERPIAFVTPRDSEVPITDLSAHLEARLRAFERPDRIEVRSELPRTAIGKIARSLLVDEAARLIALVPEEPSR